MTDKELNTLIWNLVVLATVLFFMPWIIRWLT